MVGIQIQWPELSSGPPIDGWVRLAEGVATLGIGEVQVPEAPVWPMFLTINPKSKTETVERVKHRRARSGKKATVIGKLWTDQNKEVETKTEGLEPNEWFLENIGTGLTLHAQKTEQQMLWETVEVLNQMKEEGGIQNFDFGIPLYLPFSEQAEKRIPPRKQTNSVAIFITSPYPQRESVLTRFWELQKEMGPRKSIPK